MPQLINRTRQETYITTTRALLADKTLKPTSKLIYSLLRSLAQSCENVFPTDEWIAENIGYEVEGKSGRAVHKFLAYNISPLLDMGLVVRVMTPGKGYDYEIHDYDPEQKCSHPLNKNVHTTLNKNVHTPLINRENRNKKTELEAQAQNNFGEKEEKNFYESNFRPSPPRSPHPQPPVEVVNPYSFRTQQEFNDYLNELKSKNAQFRTLAVNETTREKWAENANSAANSTSKPTEYFGYANADEFNPLIGYDTDEEAENGLEVIQKMKEKISKKTTYDAYSQNTSTEATAETAPDVLGAQSGGDYAGDQAREPEALRGGFAWENGTFTGGDSGVLPGDSRGAGGGSGRGKSTITYNPSSLSVDGITYNEAGATLENFGALVAGQFLSSGGPPMGLI